MTLLEGYASRASVDPGQRISFHVRALAPVTDYRIRIYRLGGAPGANQAASISQEEVVRETWADAPFTPSTPQDDRALAASGCSWPASYVVDPVPSAWRSGYYVAALTGYSAPDLATPVAGATADLAFVVTALPRGQRSRILLRFSDTTAQAYNSWGGHSLYTEDPPAPPQVSYDRPFFNPYATPGDPGFSGIATGAEVAFLRWAEANGFPLEYCVSSDLHDDPHYLDPYDLLLSVGHDEYWSKEMRDQVESFIANGGNVCFFSGNTCWWQVRFEPDTRTMVCYKDPAADQYPDASKRTVNWYIRNFGPGLPGLNRPENLMTGVGYLAGAGWWLGPTVAFGDPPTWPQSVIDIRRVGYDVRFPQHWVFAGTGLAEHDIFGLFSAGMSGSIIGYETDSARYAEVNGVPIATGLDGTPLNFVVLATADLSHWPPADPVPAEYSSQVPEDAAHMAPRRLWAKGGKSGAATMGIYRQNGLVFTAGTIGWANGLSLEGGWNPVDQITANLLREMSHRGAGSPRLTNGGFEQWSDGVPSGWTLEPTGTSDRISADATTTVSGRGSLKIDATAGQSWISQPFQCEGRDYYRASCWAKASAPGASLRLQSMNTWDDFAIAQHSGSGVWELLTAIGMKDDEGPLFLGRVKIQLDAGVTAFFDDVRVEVVSGTSPLLRVMNPGFEEWNAGQLVDWPTPESSGTIFGQLLPDRGRSGGRCLTIDSSDPAAGQTWIHQDLLCRGSRDYRVSCWARASQPGTASIALQIIDSEYGSPFHPWQDFADAYHSGSGQWELLSVVGRVDDEGPLFPARVRLWVQAGSKASFDDVRVESALLAPGP